MIETIRAFGDVHPILLAFAVGIGSALFMLFVTWYIDSAAKSAMRKDISELHKRIDELASQSPDGRRWLALRESSENIARDAREQAMKPQRFGGV